MNESFQKYSFQKYLLVDPYKWHKKASPAVLIEKKTLAWCVEKIDARDKHKFILS